MKRGYSHADVPALQALVENSRTFIDTAELERIEGHLGVLAARALLVDLSIRMVKSSEHTMARVGPT